MGPCELAVGGELGGNGVVELLGLNRPYRIQAFPVGDASHVLAIARVRGNLYAVGDTKSTAQGFVVKATRAMHWTRVVAPRSIAVTAVTGGSRAVFIGVQRRELGRVNGELWERGGSNWRMLLRIRGSAGVPASISEIQTVGNRLVVCGTDGVFGVDYSSTDGGRTFSPGPRGDTTSITSCRFTPTGQIVLAGFNGTSSAVDRGFAAWRLRRHVWRTDRFPNSAVSERVLGPQRARILLIGPYGSTVIETRNAAKTWSVVRQISLDVLSTLLPGAYAAGRSLYALPK